MQHLEVSGAVRYIYVVLQLRVKSNPALEWKMFGGDGTKNLNLRRDLRSSGKIRS